MTDSVLKRASVLGSVVSLTILLTALTSMSAHAAEGAVRVVCQAEGKELSAGSILVAGRVAAECPRADLFLPVGEHRIEVLQELPDGSFYRGGMSVTVRENAAQRVEVKAEKGFTEAYYHQKKDWAGLLKNYPDGQHADEARFRTLSNADYLSRYPTGAFAEEARQKIAAAEAAEAKRKREKDERDRQMRLAIERLDPDGDRKFRECAQCPEMVVVPSGSFMMGSPEGEAGRDSNEGPQRRVTIGQAFAVGKYEVTFGEWEACVLDGGCGGYRPGDEGWGRERRPVINVSWDDAQAYVSWLNRRVSGTLVGASTGSGGVGPYRLLSEAEWEYAARAGTVTAFHTGQTITPAQANFDGNYTYNGSATGVYRKRTVPVGEFAANAFGLHDMHGNVWEWTQDCWNGDYRGAPSDGAARTTGDCTFRVLRGGSWGHPPGGLRSAYRARGTSSGRDDSLVGFRVARTITP